MLPTIRFFVIMLLLTLMAGFCLVTTRTMPDNAMVLLDEQNHTYVSPGCANKEKKDYRRSTAAEALKLDYAPDKKCQDAGGVSQDNRSITGAYLVRLGMLPPLPSRWNADGTWNW
jgi:hypothetical protein